MQESGVAKVSMSPFILIPYISKNIWYLGLKYSGKCVWPYQNSEMTCLYLDFKECANEEKTVNKDSSIS